jgi:uncharacterized membrane protein YhiD involved in acid resistance
MMIAGLPTEIFTTETGDPIEVALRAATSMLVAVGLTIAVALVYRATHRGVQYSAAFSTTLVMLSAVGTLVMIVIGDSMARAFGVFGALSLIRFRTAVKDPKDIAFVFLSLAIGMAAGTGRFLIAGAGTAVMILVVVVLSVIRFGARVRDDYLLRLVYSGPEATKEVPRLLEGSAKRVVLLTLQSFGDGVEATWLITAKSRPDEVIAALRAVPGVTDVHLTATAEEVEL